MKSGKTSRTRRGVVALLLLFTSIIVTAGCGYRFSAGGESIDSRLQTVFVDNIANTTNEPLIEIYVRNGFEDQFRKSNRFRLTNSKESADILLTGTITSLSLPAVAYDRYDKATEGRAVMTLDLLLEERESRKKIWAVSAFSGNETYRIDQTNPNATSLTKTTALQKLSNDMAEKAFRNLMSGF